MSNVATKFAALFKKALTDKDKTAKQKDTDYYNLNFFINGLKKAAHFQECLDEYLRLFGNYQPLDRRSKFVFAQLLTKRIDASKPDDKFIGQLSNALADPTVSVIKLRFEDLEDREKKEIKNALAYKLQLKKQETSVLDLLKEAYEKEKGAKPDGQALLNYDPVSDPSYLEKFDKLRGECRAAWSTKDAEGIEPVLRKYITFLSKETDAMKLFQVIKWTRDVATNQPYKVVTGPNGETQTYRHVHDSLDCELYFQAMFWLLIWARKKLYQKNRWDFTPEEKGFFIGPLTGDYYFSNYYNRFEAGRTGSADFAKASVLFVRLLMFARITNAIFVNDTELLKVRRILEDPAQRPMLKKKSFYLNVGRDLFKGHVRIGSNMGKANVIYFEDYKNNDEQFIYIEFVDLKNLLLKVSASRLAEINEDSFYTLVWEQTRHLLVLIPAFWKLIGFLVTFLTGGVFALVKDIAADIIIGEVADHMGTSGSGTSQALNMGFLLFRKGKMNASGLEQAAAKGFKNLGEEEAKAAKALLKLSDEELKAARVAGKLTQEEVKAIKSAAKYLDDEAKAMKAVDDLKVQEAKVANSKASVVGGNSRGVAATGTGNKAAAANPKLGAVDDAVRNNGTGKTTQGAGGGGAKGNTPLGVKGIPVTNKGVIDWNDAVKIAEDMGEKSPWVKKLDDIAKITDPVAKDNAVRNFITDFEKARNVNIEVITGRGKARGLTDSTPWRYDADSNTLFMHEDLIRSGTSIKDFREVIKTVETNRAFKDLPLPKDMKTVVSGVPLPLRGQVKSLPDVIAMQTQPIRISMDQAQQIIDAVRSRSEWLRELTRISNIKDMAARHRELKMFAAVYSQHTPYKIKFLPAAEAAAKGLDGRNLGTFVQAEKTIYMHEGVLNMKYGVKEVGHEVGAAELYRVFGINKDAIPLVDIAPGPFGGNYLTHILDMYIRRPE